MVRAVLTTVFVVLFVLVACTTTAEAPRDAFALAKDLEIDGPIPGDAVVIAGDLILGPQSRIGGDAIAVLGTVRSADGAVVEGRVIALSSLATLDPEPISGIDGSWRPGLFFVTAGLWLTAVTLIAALAPFKVRQGVFGLRISGWRVVPLGFVTVSLLFAALIGVLGLGPRWGVNLAGVLMLCFLTLKAVGLAILGAWFGGLVRAGYGVGWPTSVDVLLTVGLLLCLRLVPVLGGPVWGVISIVSVGVGLIGIIAVWPRMSRIVPARNSVS